MLIPPGYLPPGHQTPDLLLHSDIGADGIADLPKGASFVRIDAAEIAHVLGKIHHFRQPPFHAAVVPVVYKSIVNACEIAQSIPRFQALLCLPGARRGLHAIDEGRRHDLHSTRFAPVQKKLDQRRHIDSRGVDRATQAKEKVEIGVWRLAVAMIKNRQWRRRLLEIGGRLHADRQKEISSDEILKTVAGNLLHYVGSHRRPRVGVRHAGPGPPA